MLIYLHWDQDAITARAEMNTDNRNTPDTTPSPDNSTKTRPGFFARAPRAWLYGSLGVALVGLLGVHALRPHKVEVASVQLQPAERVLAITGRTRPQVTVTILPRVAGQVVRLTKEEGDRVTQGEVIALLDAAAPSAAVEQSASVVSAQERVLVQAEREYERAQSLQARGLITIKAFEDARFALDQAKVELARLQATRREVATRLQDTRMLAPVSGVVLTRPVDVGQVVSTTSTIYEIAPLKDVEIEAEIDEQFLSEMREGMKALIGVAGISSPVAATLYYISPKVDPRIGGAKVRFRFDEPVNDLRAGVTVDINLVVEKRDSALTVNRAQILGRDAAAAVLVVADGVVERRPVGYVEWPSTRVIVTEGLKAGEQLVLTPRADLVGKKVHAIDVTARDRAAQKESARAL